MAAKESAEMGVARVLVMTMGKTPYAAAKQVGLTRSAIYMAPWYKEWKVSPDYKAPWFTGGGLTCAYFGLRSD